MAKSLNDRIIFLETQVKSLETALNSALNRLENVTPQPTSRVPQINYKHGRVSPSTGTGLGKVANYDAGLIFNDADLKGTPWRTQPTAPQKGYNKHSHSRFAGGALDIHTLELVEYTTSDPDADDPVILDANGRALNKHCQNYWDVQPNIVKENGVDKIGMLDIAFDTDSKKWVAGAGLIDVEKTYLVQYEYVIEDGKEVKKIKKDSNGAEMKSPLLYALGSQSDNLDKSNVIWDADAECWRFYAVFKPTLESLGE